MEKDKTQLLCTFCAEDTLDGVVTTILGAYDVAFDSLYVLENTDSPGQLCLTYNIYTDSQIRQPVPVNTISLHRKKHSNTLYTINALNKFVAQNNGGKLDKNFVVDWSTVKNSILVTTYDKLRKIPTKVKKIIDIRNL
jgi:hypothetical protein